MYFCLAMIRGWERSIATPSASGVEPTCLLACPVALALLATIAALADRPAATVELARRAQVCATRGRAPDTGRRDQAPSAWGRPDRRDQSLAVPRRSADADRRPPDPGGERRVPRRSSAARARRALGLSSPCADSGSGGILVTSAGRWSRSLRLAADAGRPAVSRVARDRQQKRRSCATRPCRPT